MRFQPSSFVPGAGNTSDNRGSYNTKSTDAGPLRQAGSPSRPGYVNPAKSNVAKPTASTPKAQPTTKAQANTKASSVGDTKQSSTVRTDAAGRILGGV